MAVEELLKSANKLTKSQYFNLNDNVFSILKITDKEIFHCRFLKYLIKNDWRGFCNTVLGLPKLGESSLAKIECEYPAERIDCMKTDINDSKDGRIDILCETEKDVVAIEVKWYAKDQPQQLLRYYRRLKASFKDKTPRLVYLTLQEKTASKGSTECPKFSNCNYKSDCCILREENYIRTSFKKVKDWIEDKQEEIIRQYYNVLNREMNMSTAVNLIINNKEDYYAANTIADAISEAQSEIRKAFIKRLGEKILIRFGKENIETVEDKELEKYKYDGYVNRNECLAYKLKDKYLLVWAATSLYWQLGKSCQYIDGDAWSYINSHWFNNLNAQIDKDERSGNSYKVDAKYLKDEDNKIVEWYFSTPEQQEKAMDIICQNMYNTIIPLL